MARYEFLQNFRVARNLFDHSQVPLNGATFGSQVAEQRAARVAIWLTPKSVKDFDPADFPELGQDRQKELQAAVQEFLAVANHVPPNILATPEQLAKATAAFAKLRQILLPYTPILPEDEHLKEFLKSVDLPEWVVSWDCKLDSDFDGMEVLWITFFVDENGGASRMEIFRFFRHVERTLLDTFVASGSDTWPHVQIDTALEHKRIRTG